MSSSIRGKRSWHYDCRLGQCAAYRLDQAPEVPLQCLRLPQLGVIHPRMQHLQPFRIAGICAETPRTRASGKQWVCNLPSANVVRTCRTMEFPMITAPRSISRRGSKQLRVEISKAEGSGGGEVAARGLDRVFCYCTHCPWFLGTGMKEIWEDHVPVAGLCRETHGVEVVGVLAARCILTPDLWASARDVSSIALRSLNWVCFPSSSPICFSTVSSFSCTECSSNVFSPVHKGRHKSASETNGKCVRIGY